MKRLVRSSPVRLLLAPSAIYLLSFVILTWPAICSFSTHFYCDELDGLQNVWNLWWVNKAVVELHQNPWYTNWLQYPHGTTLVGHTLNPFNGFVGIPLRMMLSPVQVYNVILTMTFVTGGLFTFWLARYLTASYWPSIVAGYAFTFSSFHFAHAQGHLQLASLQFIPLFMLAWLRLIEGPTVLRGFLAGLVLGLLVLCDYYYTFFCILAASISLLWSLPVLRRARALPLGIFAVTTLLCAGPLIGSLLWINAHDSMVGAHPVEIFSTDLPAALIPGRHWVGNALTKPYWSNLPGNPEEQSLYLGLAVLILAGYGLTAKTSLTRPRSAGLWLTMAMVFAVLSLGPQLRAFGKPLTGPILPYAWLTEIIPPLRLAGVPARMMVMTLLVACLLSSYGLAHLWRTVTPTRVAVGSILIFILIVERWPAGLALTPLGAPTWVTRLAEARGSGGAYFDLDISETKLLYYQTIHQKPQALGYISRAPASVVEKNRQIRSLYHAGRSDLLRDKFGFRWVVRKRGDEVIIEDLGNSP
jgi:hypothetical protein